MTAIEYNFNCRASDGVCDICGKSAPVIADIVTMQCKCFECLIKGDLKVKKQKQPTRIPLDLEDFIAS